MSDASPYGYADGPRPGLRATRSGVDWTLEGVDPAIGLAKAELLSRSKPPKVGNEMNMISKLYSEWLIGGRRRI